MDAQQLMARFRQQNRRARIATSNAFANRFEARRVAEELSEMQSIPLESINDLGIYISLIPYLRYQVPRPRIIANNPQVRWLLMKLFLDTIVADILHLFLIITPNLAAVPDDAGAEALPDI